MWGLMGSFPERAAIPTTLRRPAAVGVALAASVFAVLAMHYADTSVGGRLDHRLEAVADSATAARHWLLTYAVALGSPPIVVVGALALAVVCLVLRRRRLAVLAILGPGLTGAATTLSKPAIGRTMEDGGFAYPSGHTGGATALGLLAALLAVSLLRPGRVIGMALVAAGALLAGGIVGVAMVVVGVHYPTDTIGGFCTAVVVVLGLALAIEWLTDKRRARSLRG